MSELQRESLRNVAMISSAGAGKTSLAEAMLFAAGAVPHLGSIAQGTTVSDFEPEELHRRSSVSTSLLRCSWNHTTINLVDPPGALSLLGETVMALRAVDAVILVVGASSGIRSELVRVWARVTALGLPCLLFLNELDKDATSLDGVIAMCQRDLGIMPLPMSLPYGSGTQLEGVLDLLRQSVITSRTEVPTFQQMPIPENERAVVGDARKRVQEGVAERDDRLLEQYLTAGELTQEDLFNELRLGVQAGTIVPLYSGSAIKNIGIAPLLNAIVDFLPSPMDRASRTPLEGLHPGTGEAVSRHAVHEDPFSGVVFKTLIDPFVGRLSYLRVLSGVLHADSTVFNSSRGSKEKSGHLYTLLGKKHTAVSLAGAGEIVAIGKLKDTQTGDTLCDEHAPICYPKTVLPRPVLSFAIEPKSNADIEKISLGLHKLIEEDPTLEFSRHADTKEIVLSGMGQLHIDLALEKLRRKYGAEVVLRMPKIPYRETIRTTAQAQGKYKKQTGGHGQYGDCWLELAPLPRGEGFKFENKVVGGAIPRNFIPAVEKGVVEAMHHGSLAGFPIVDCRVAVYDGSYHAVDSSEMAFKIAASMGFKNALEAAHAVLLEPIMTVEVDAPADHIGGVIGDLNARRGRILHVEAKDQMEQITALVPMAELLTYATALNSLTAGRGSYAMEFTRYDEVPRELVVRIIEAHKVETHAATH
ncbi:MAG TPA: elongation factor G [Nitrospiraceae bacterium]|nr:elongation factor G [Nitrospiraceae bacterium]